MLPRRRLTPGTEKYVVAAYPFAPGPNAIPLARSGKLQILATTSAAGAHFYPGAPTLEEDVALSESAVKRQLGPLAAKLAALDPELRWTQPALFALAGWCVVRGRADGFGGRFRWLF